jgi:hypothetical protein
MGTIRKYWRKLRRWFEGKGRDRLEEAKRIIRDVLSGMRIRITDLFDDEKRMEIADELRRRLDALRHDLTEWIIDLALDALWDEVREGFSRRRTQ